MLWEARSPKSCTYHSLQLINLTFDLRALSASCCNHVGSLFGKVLFQGVNCLFEGPALASLATLLALVMALSATSLFFGDSLDGCCPGLLVLGGIAPDFLIKSFA